MNYGTYTSTSFFPTARNRSFPLESCSVLRSCAERRKLSAAVLAATSEDKASKSFGVIVYALGKE